VDTVRKSDQEARVGFEGKRVLGDRDFLLYYATSQEEFGANLIAHRERGEDGFLLVLLAPKTGFGEEELPAKDIVFVFDTSGSMAGDKIDQARRALVFCLDNLAKEDRFNVVTFATSLREFDDELVQASDDTVENAIDFVEKMKAVGGTNIEEAMTSALKMLRGSSRPSMVLFLTDGYPTVGETDTDKLVDLIGDENGGKRDDEHRIFTFGVGDEVNAQLLDRVTRDNGGAAEYVRPKEDIELKVSSFYAKVSRPVLTDIEMDIDGVKTYDVYPTKLGDLFYGTELRVLGRYDGEGDAKLTLTGETARGREHFTYNVYLPQREDAYGFIPRLWAIRKVGYLLDEIRLKGENKELKDEIVDLALTYGIVTPYTSFLVNEDERVIAQRPELTRRAFLDAQRAHDAFGGYGGGGYGGLSGSAYSGLEARGAGAMGMPGGGGMPGMPGPKGDTGAAAPAPGMMLGQGWMSEQAGADAIVGAQGIRGMQVNDGELRLNQRNVQNIGRATFYYDPQTGTWTDSRFDPQLATLDVQRDSEAFVQLIAARPDLARYFAQGPRVIYRLGASNVRVGDTGFTHLSAAQLAGLQP
jgi:Ca-activated chloride channel family protein